MTNVIWSGLIQGAIFAVVAFGFTLGRLPSGMVNFAQGALVVASAYLTYLFFHHLRLPLIAVVVLDLLCGATMGILCERLTIRPVVRRRVGGAHPELVTTIGMATAVAGACGVAWGYVPVPVPFHGPTGTIAFLGVRTNLDGLIIVGGSILIAALLSGWFGATRVGQACLAASENRDAAELRGIDVNRLSLGAFATAGALAGVAGLAIGPATYAAPGLANTFALGGFVALALGGERSFLGNLVGGLIAGVVSALVTRYIGAEYSDLSVLALLIITLTTRPGGLGSLGEVRSV